MNTRLFLDELRRALREEARRFAGVALHWPLVDEDHLRCRYILGRLVEDVLTPKSLRDRAAEGLRLLGCKGDAAAAQARRRSALLLLRANRPNRPARPNRPSIAGNAGNVVDENVYLRSLLDYNRRQRRQADVKRMIERTIRRAMKGVRP